ncbi:MAG: ATP-binding protein [Pseudonocardiaceae bacterium]
MFTKGIAVAWGLRHLAKDAETLAVELVTRAVETTGNPNPHPTFTELRKKPPPNIGIRITRQDHGILIEVWDSDPTPPQGADAHLAIVANFSQDWGCYRPRGGGKVIWAELTVPSQHHTPHKCGVCA